MPFPAELLGLEAQKFLLKHTDGYKPLSDSDFARILGPTEYARVSREELDSLRALDETGRKANLEQLRQALTGFTYGGHFAKQYALWRKDYGETLAQINEAIRLVSERPRDAELVLLRAFPGAAASRTPTPESVKLLRQLYVDASERLLRDMAEWYYLALADQNEMLHPNPRTAAEFAEDLYGAIERRAMRGGCVVVLAIINVTFWLAFALVGKTYGLLYGTEFGTLPVLGSPCLCMPGLSGGGPFWRPPKVCERLGCGNHVQVRVEIFGKPPCVLIVATRGRVVTTVNAFLNTTGQNSCANFLVGQILPSTLFQESHELSQSFVCVAEESAVNEVLQQFRRRFRFSRQSFSPSR